MKKYKYTVESWILYIWRVASEAFAYLTLPWSWKNQRWKFFFLFRGKRGEEEEDILDLNDWLTWRHYFFKINWITSVCCVYSFRCRRLTITWSRWTRGTLCAVKCSSEYVCVRPWCHSTGQCSEFTSEIPVSSCRWVDWRRSTPTIRTSERASPPCC